MMPSVANTMRSSAVIALLFLASLPAVAGAQDGFVVITNVGNPITTLRRDDVSKLFLRTRTRWPQGQRAEPMDQVESSPVRRRFSNSIHGMDVPSVKGFWQEMVFSGKGDPPVERASDGEVVAFVKTHPYAIGYVSSVSPVDGVRAILVTP
jgi:ABC-type phosphate transport system substrate-binding protein